MFKFLKGKANWKIAGATMTIIFSLAAAFSGTIAWFGQQRAATVKTGSFEVTAGDGVSFDLYYLHHFAVDESTNKNGNYNYDTGLYSGYELDYANPVFNQVNYDEDGHVIGSSDPTNISHLWPAHIVTYAIVITAGNLSSFSLDSWGEITSPDVITQVNSEDVRISLSWATNMFGGAYYVTSTESVTDDIATGFASYVSDEGVTDKFPYSQTNIAPEQKPAIEIVDSVSGTSGEGKRAILYFSIEFSNDSSTFYSYRNPYYIRDDLGDSNCYEKLSLSNLVFKLV